MGPDLLRGHVDSLLLSVLTDEPAHGYAVAQRVAERSGNELHLPEGSLYPALQRLERRRLVSSTWHVVDGRRRRVYTLSTAGRQEATRAAEEWRRFSSAVTRVVGGTA